MITKEQRLITRKKNEVTVRPSENPYLLSALCDIFKLSPKKPTEQKKPQPYAF